MKAQHKAAQEIVLDKYEKAVYRDRTARTQEQRIQAETERMVLCEVLVDALSVSTADISRARVAGELRAETANKKYRSPAREPAPDLTTLEPEM